MNWSKPFRQNLHVDILQVILEFGCKNNINSASNPKFCEDFLRTSPYVSPTPRVKRTGKEEVQAFPLETHPQKSFQLQNCNLWKRSALKNMVFSADLIFADRRHLALVLIGFRRWGRGAPFVGILQGVLHILENKLAMESKASTFGANRWPHRWLTTNEKTEISAAKKIGNHLHK